jgi:tetratricopeptide (TPR) repeat protein
VFSGDIVGGRARFDQAVALSDPAAHHPFWDRFGKLPGTPALCWRSFTLRILGYPEAARADADRALNDARVSGDAATLMLSLFFAAWNHGFCGNCPASEALVDELIALTNEKSAIYWKATGITIKGWLLCLNGITADAIEKLSFGCDAYWSTEGTSGTSFYLSYLAGAYADIGQFDDAWRSMDIAITAVTKANERWCEPEVHRLVGEITLKSSEPDAAKAEVNFERALTVARSQQAKSWELRAAMSMAKLWRDQGKRTEAHDLLAPVYGWFTEGFDTLDLKEARLRDGFPVHIDTAGR